MLLRVVVAALAMLWFAPREAECLSLGSVELVTPFGELGYHFAGEAPRTSSFAGVTGREIASARVVLPGGASVDLVQVSARAWIGEPAEPWASGVYRFVVNEGLADALEYEVPFIAVASPALPDHPRWTIAPADPWGYFLDLAWDGCATCSPEESFRDLVAAAGPIVDPPPPAAFLLSCPVGEQSARCELGAATWRVTIQRTFGPLLDQAPLRVVSATTGAVRFDLEVPEPGAGALAAIGVLATLACRRKR